MIRVRRNKRGIAPLAGGQSNTASNVGTAGTGVFKQKTASDLEFMKLNTGTAGGVAVALDAVNSEVDLTLDIHSLALGATPVSTDRLAFSDEDTVGDPTKYSQISTVWAKAFVAICNVEGDIVYQGVGGVVPTKLAIGTAGQLCVVNAGATAPSWATAKRTIELLAAGGKATTTSGCGDLTHAETTTHKVNYQYLPFDKTAAELAFWPPFFLSNWNAGNFKFRVAWTAASDAGHGVAWTLQGISYTDGDADDVAFGAAKTVLDDLDTAGDIQISPWSTEDLVLGATPTAGDLVTFQLGRNVAHADDDLDDDARLIAVEIIYTTGSYTDA